MNQTPYTVLFLLTKDDTGGATRYVRDISSQLNTHAFFPVVLMGKTHIHWLSNHTYPFLLFFNDWLAIFELIRAYRKVRPHLIHLNNSKAGVLGTIAAYVYNLTAEKKVGWKAAVVFTAHGWVFNPQNRYPRLVLWLFRTLHHAVARAQDAIICVSEYDRKLASTIAPQEKLVTIRNGVPPTVRFLSRDESRAHVRSLLEEQHKKIPEALPWIGSVGRLVKEKDYATLIAAARMVEHALFFIIGDGPERERLKDQISRFKMDDRFFIISPTGNDARYLKAFDLFVLSSIKEGLPYALLEAMTAELPVVVTDAGGMKEIVHVAVPPKNPNALARTIENTLHSRHAPPTPPAFADMLSKTQALYFRVLKPH